MTPTYSNMDGILIIFSLRLFASYMPRTLPVRWDEGQNNSGMISRKKVGVFLPFVRLHPPHFIY